jgi:feruloyl esterase
VAGGLLTAALPAFAAGSQADTTPLACDAAAMRKAVSSGTTVVSARRLTTPNTGTAYCRVDGHVTTSGPAGENRVNFQLSLPGGFTGRYLYLGIGGAAGAVTEPEEPLLRDGWAQASSDARGPGSVLDYTFAADRTAALDWASRGVKVTTAETQAIARAYYRPRHMFRYLSGCSGGGRMGLVEASLHPSDYDGILAGAPGTDSLNVLKFGQVVDHLLREPESWPSPAQLQRLETELVRTYDASDGALDGFIRDPGEIDTSVIGTLGIFTPAQLTVIKMITSDLKVGDRTYKAFSASNPSGWASFLTGTVPPADWNTQPPASLILFDTNTRALFGLSYDFRTRFDFADPADLRKWTTAFDEVFPRQNPGPADFDAFRAKGGKIVIWHGASDNGISLFDNIDLYQRIASHQGGYAAAQRSIRMFSVPGLLHCFGGPGPQDIPGQGLSALASWVEQGRPPGEIVAHSAPGQPAAGFLLCPYPAAPAFKGGPGSDPRDAADWRCPR